MRVELRDGQWAEMRARITHGADKRIKRARIASQNNSPEIVEWQTVLIREFVQTWHVLDLAGVAIPLDDADAIDRTPDDIADSLFVEAHDRYKAATVPNPPTPPSSEPS